MIDAGVRKYTKEDRESVQDICFRTGFMGDSAERYWRHKPSFVEVWTSYYTEHEPESLWVAVKADSVVGYLTGCLNTSLAPKTDDTLLSAIMKHRLMFRPGTAGFLWRGLFDGFKDRQASAGELLDERWPSHLHMNLLPAARGIGLGAALMESWLAQLRQSESPGCHLGTLVENTRAVSFFEKMGFKRHGEPTLIPGMRGSGGERLHQQFMVWSAS